MITITWIAPNILKMEINTILNKTIITIDFLTENIGVFSKYLELSLNVVSFLAMLKWYNIWYNSMGKDYSFTTRNEKLLWGACI